MFGKKNSQAVFFLGIALMILLGAVVFIAYSRADSGEGGTPLISVEPPSLDWGAISAATGSVSKTFAVSNPGTADLVIRKIATSCGCTTAVLKTASGATPRLGMDHGNLPRIKEVIKPGETAELIVTFDPNFHYVRGRTERVVYIESNVPGSRETEVSSVFTVTD